MNITAVATNTRVTQIYQRTIKTQSKGLDTPLMDTNTHKKRFRKTLIPTHLHTVASYHDTKKRTSGSPDWKENPQINSLASVKKTKLVNDCKLCENMFLTVAEQRDVE